MEEMSITVNGKSLVPPGFRFHPTEEELLDYYLRKKIAGEKVDLNIMKDVDLNRLEPWEIQEKCKIGSAPQNDWYFFSHKDRKYPTGTRTNRATTVGFWKATGRDKPIFGGFRRIGMRKTLVFYSGRAPNGQKSDWIMHEYRLEESNSSSTACSPLEEAELAEEGWVVCRVFKKKSYLRVSESGAKEEGDLKRKEIFRSCSDGTLDQIIKFLSRSCKQEKNEVPLAYPVLADGAVAKQTLFPCGYPAPVDQLGYGEDDVEMLLGVDHVYGEGREVNDWAGLDRLVDSHVNGQRSFPEEDGAFGCPQVNGLLYGDAVDVGFWAFTVPPGEDSQSTSRG